MASNWGWAAALGDDEAVSSGTSHSLPRRPRRSPSRSRSPPRVSQVATGLPPTPSGLGFPPWRRYRSTSSARTFVFYVFTFPAAYAHTGALVCERARWGVGGSYHKGGRLGQPIRFGHAELAAFRPQQTEWSALHLRAMPHRARLPLQLAGWCAPRLPTLCVGAPSSRVAPSRSAAPPVHWSWCAWLPFARLRLPSVRLRLPLCASGCLRSCVCAPAAVCPLPRAPPPSR